MKVIQAGDYGRDVEIWQRFLAQIWLLEHDRALPGSFDEPTAEGTRAFQQECGLEPTGIVDRDLIERANARGLRGVESQVTGLFPARIFIAIISAFVLSILVVQCMVLPDGGKSMQGVQLPVSPTLTPNAPQPRPCPSLFC